MGKSKEEQKKVENVRQREGRVRWGGGEERVYNERKEDDQGQWPHCVRGRRL